jgi:CDP-glycerol glycerophosphotransferase (TagB/SpsB family)
MGLQVLDFFAENPGYNLIFAPHVVLFKRYVRHKGYLPGKYRQIPNILVDTGSSASSDMTYMLNSDIYLGDVSSQVYEFLLEPRPCIHLNGHHVDWKNDPYYYHFTLGQVVEDVEKQLGTALAQAFDTHAAYLDEQRRAFAYTFHTQADSTAAQRGADAIARFLSERGASSASVE